MPLAQRHHSRTFRSRKALLVTETELRLIAAPAMIGLSSKPKTGVTFDHRAINGHLVTWNHAQPVADFHLTWYHNKRRDPLERVHQEHYSAGVSYRL